MTTKLRPLMRTFYGQSLVLPEEADAPLTLVVTTVCNCVLRRLRIDGPARTRRMLGIRKVTVWRDEGILRSTASGDGGSGSVNVGTLERTKFRQDWPCATSIQVELEPSTWDVGAEVRLVADIEIAWTEL